MGEFARTVPKNIRELKENLAKLAENSKHVKGVSVNSSTGHLEITLDWAAHHIGSTPDFYLPLKAGSTHQAQELVNKIVREIQNGSPPSEAEVTELYGYIDPAGQ